MITIFASTRMPDGFIAAIRNSELVWFGPENKIPEDIEFDGLISSEGYFLKMREHAFADRDQLAMEQILAMTDEELRADAFARGTTPEAEAEHCLGIFRKAMAAVEQKGITK